MSKRKTFTKGQVVEVWRRIFERWERGVYEGPSGAPGVHRIRLGGGLMKFTTRNVRERQESP